MVEDRRTYSGSARAVSFSTYWECPLSSNGIWKTNGIIIKEIYMIENSVEEGWYDHCIDRRHSVPHRQPHLTGCMLKICGTIVLFICQERVLVQQILGIVEEWLSSCEAWMSRSKSWEIFGFSASQHRITPSHVIRRPVSQRSIPYSATPNWTSIMSHLFVLSPFDSIEVILNATWSLGAPINSEAAASAAS